MLDKDKNKFNFSDAKIRNIALPASGRIEYYDEGQAGLVLRVSATGNKSFCVFRRVSGSEPIRHTIGKYGTPWNVEMARKETKQVLASLANSIDPADAKRKLKSEITFEELFNLYVEDRVKAGRNGMDGVRGRYERYIGKMPDCPVKKHGIKRTKSINGVDWSTRKISTITHSDVEALHSSIAKENAITANRIVSIISAMYGFANRKQITNENPAKHITKSKENEIIRYFSEAEARSFNEALSQKSQLWRDYLSVLMYVGYRRAAIQSMQWSDLVGLEENADSIIWYVRGEKSKNGEPITLPIMNDAVIAIKRRFQERRAGAIWVFEGGGRNGHITSPEKAWRRVLKRACIEQFRLHDLRHNLATVMINNDVELVTVGRVLGHKDARSTLRYAHLQTVTAVNALEKAHNAMKSVINNKKVSATPA